MFAFPGLGNAIISAYNAIEFWVDYGVDVAAYAAGWIPLGWLIARPDQHLLRQPSSPPSNAIFYNIGWWVGGSISFLEAA